METTRVRHVLNSLMILSFLIFGLLSGLILILDIPLTNASVSLPFSFLFISLITLVTTGRIDETPQMANRFLREWLLVCIFGTIIGALTFMLA